MTTSIKNFMERFYMNKLLNSFLLTILLSSNSVLSDTNLITVNGIKLDVRIKGQEYKIIEFESGFGTDASVWNPITDKLSSDYKTIQYSRAELGNSQKAEKLRTIDESVSDLKELLLALNLYSPVILVGHSFGSLLPTEVVQSFPEFINALVLVDPDTTSQRNAFKSVNVQRVAKDDQLLLEYMPSNLQQRYQLLIKQLDKLQTKNVPTPSSIPVVLLTSTKVYKQPFVFEETPEGCKIWLHQHRALIEKPKRSAHIPLNKIGHNIHTDKPNLIIDAIGLSQSL
ncbi:alpha/beta hydrolase [uncultured Psychrosphaera sp.]|uniref:alpha/beta fold hydrolase n=1 Tax=uncultured Psychrosphaera sp. TaxID=1403522 RepID=UPI0030F5E348